MKMNYSIVLALALVSQQALSVNDGQLQLAAKKLGVSAGKITSTVKNWAALATPADVVNAYNATISQAAPQPVAAPKPTAAPKPVAAPQPSSDSSAKQQAENSDLKKALANEKDAHQQTKVDKANSLAHLQREIDKLEQSLADEKTAHAQTKAQATNKVTAAAAGMTNEAIAGAAELLIKQSGVRPDEAAGKAILTKLGQSQQSKTLGRLGKKRYSKKEYAH